MAGSKKNTKPANSTCKSFAAKAGKAVIAVAILAPLIGSARTTSVINTAQMASGPNMVRNAVFAGDFEAFVLRAAAIPSTPTPVVPSQPTGSIPQSYPSDSFDDRNNYQGEPMRDCIKVYPQNRGADVLVNRRFCPIGYRSDV